MASKIISLIQNVSTPIDNRYKSVKNHKKNETNKIAQINSITNRLKAYKIEKL